MHHQWFDQKVKLHAVTLCSGKGFNDVPYQRNAHVQCNKSAQLSLHMSTALVRHIVEALARTQTR